MDSKKSGPSAFAGHWIHRVVALCILLALSACGGNSPNEASAGQAKQAALSAVATSDVVVTGLTKVSETRVSRTAFDYVFQVTVKNNGTDSLTGVTATLTGAGPGTSIVDGTVQVGGLAAGATATPPDTITIRQDRALPFDKSALVWQITATSSPPTTGGALLIGDPSQPAEQATIDFSSQGPEDLATAQAPGSNTEYYVSQLAAGINPEATVGQVNAALNGVGGRISYMRQKDAAITIQVPNPGSLAALEAIASNLMATGAFEIVVPGFVPKTQALPSNVTPTEALQPGGAVFHHIAARVTAAWNASNVDASSAPVDVIVIDYFGNGGTTEINGTADGFLSGRVCDIYDAAGTHTGVGDCDHGYHVLGIIAGSFGGDNTPIGKVTGSLPKNLRVHIIDLSRLLFSPKEPAWQVIDREMLKIITASPSHRFVINFSLGFCNTPGNCVTASQAASAGAYWRWMARRFGRTLPAGTFDYDKQVIQVSAAGNNGATGVAQRASMWNASVILGTLFGKYPQLTNGLVVENRTAVPSPDIAKGGIAVPGPLAASSTRNGNIGAIGTNVYSFISPTNAGNLSGTSMASPQVAGIAAYMLASRPAMTSNELVSELIGTSQAPLAGAAPMIDAYAALLGLDKYLGDDSFDAPTRRALLQPTATIPKATFGSNDALQFLQALFPAAYPNIPRLPANPNFSRFDLNGDGFTGDISKRAPFDLKFDMPIGSPPKYEVLDKYPNDMPITLNENAVTDFEVLCYYVNSSLFDQSQRVDFDNQLVDISNSLNRTISCNDRIVILNVNATNPGWVGLPAKITLSNFVPQFPATLAGNSSTCTNQGVLPGERGIPLFSMQVPSPITIYAAIDVVGVPSQTGREPNRRNCSSFFASAGQQVWINATGRTVFGFGTGFVSDWEYQVRYTNGDPFGIGKRCTIGVVPGSGFFLSAFDDSTCTHSETARTME